MRPNAHRTVRWPTNEELKQKQKQVRNIFKTENLIRISSSCSVQENKKKEAKIKSSAPKRKIQKARRLERE